MLSRRLILILAAALIAAFVFGWMAGLKSERGAKTLSTTECDARWPGGPKASCDEVGGDGDFAMNVRDLHWTSETSSGDGRPPCLTRDNEKVRVEVGYLDVRQPDDTIIEDVVLWVRCP